MVQRLRWRRQAFSGIKHGAVGAPRVELDVGTSAFCDGQHARIPATHQPSTHTAQVQVGVAGQQALAAHEALCGGCTDAETPQLFRVRNLGQS